MQLQPPASTREASGFPIYQRNVSPIKLLYQRPLSARQHYTPPSIIRSRDG